MYIGSLILAILGFISAFLPGYGVIGVIIFGIISVIASIINYKSNEKKIRDTAIISIIVVVISTVVCCVINNYYSYKVVKNYNYNYNNISYMELIKDYPLYKTSDTIMDEYSTIKIEDVSYDGDLVLVSVDVTFLGEERYFSNYDFCIVDAEEDNVFFPKYEREESFLNSEFLENGEELSGLIKFDIGYNAIGKSLYLVYSDEKSKFKIQL